MAKWTNPEEPTQRLLAISHIPIHLSERDVRVEVEKLAGPVEKLVLFDGKGEVKDGRVLCKSDDSAKTAAEAGGFTMLGNWVELRYFNWPPGQRGGDTSQERTGGQHQPYETHGKEGSESAQRGDSESTQRRGSKPTHEEDSGGYWLAGNMLYYGFSFVQSIIKKVQDIDRRFGLSTWALAYFEQACHQLNKLDEKYKARERVASHADAWDASLGISDKVHRTTEQTRDLASSIQSTAPVQHATGIYNRAKERATGTAEQTRQMVHEQEEARSS